MRRRPIVRSRDKVFIVAQVSVGVRDALYARARAEGVTASDVIRRGVMAALAEPEPGR